MTTHQSLADFFNELQKHIHGELRTDEYTRILYSTDASIYQVKPYGVLLPRSSEEVQAAVELAAKYKIPLLPRTGGSSLAGQAVNEAVVIDFTPHLNNILEINEEEKWVRVQPGIVLDVMNSKLRPFGLQYGPDPASSNRAAMGGIVANNATGSHSIVYGMTADHLLETQVYLSDGSTAHFKSFSPDMVQQKQKTSGLEGNLYQEIENLVTKNSDIIKKGTPKYWRRCGGYNLDRFVEGLPFKHPQEPGFNLAKLICGSEGTLAIMNEIKLNLVPRPTKTAVAVVHFNSLYEALNSSPTILEVNPSTVELIDNLGLTLCQDVPAYARVLNTFIHGQPHCVLITEFYGDSDGELKDKMIHLTEHLKKYGVKAHVVQAIDPQVVQNIWYVRKVALGLMMSVKGDHKPTPFIEDAAVPVNHLADYVTQIEKFCNDLGTNIAYYAHASAGCIHIRPLLNTKLAQERTRGWAVEKLAK
jgi:FAD/FMN-containing dehydrogenase